MNLTYNICHYTKIKKIFYEWFFLSFAVLCLYIFIFETFNPLTETGLIYLLISACLIIPGFESLVSFYKGIFLGISEKNPIGKSTKDERCKIAFFSEGKNYWGTFKPIIQALIKMRVDFSYFTLDIDDPALLIVSEFMKSKFLGHGVWAYYKVSNIESDILVSTTPNIGNSGFPIKRPDKVKNMIHIFHSINDISFYKTGSLDFYDSVVLVGNFQIKSIRKIEEVRNLLPKELISLGLPYTDELIIEKCEKKIKNERKTVLIGSSWGPKGCLKSYGIDFIKDIISAGYNVIIRPHPQSFISEPDLIHNYKQQLKNYANVVWDEMISPSKAMNSADILISDTSSIRFDFAFIYKKPVITLAISTKEMSGYERDYLDRTWSDETETKIGFVIKKESINQMNKYIQMAFEEYDSSKIDSFRDQTICNFGCSGEEIANYLSNKTREFVS